MSIVVNPFGKVHATFQDAKEFSHKESYWARIQRKDGAIEYKFLKAGTRDHEELIKAKDEGDVTKVILFSARELKDYKGCFERAADCAESVSVIGHILKGKEDNIIKLTEDMMRKGFSREEGIKIIKGAAGGEEWINARLRQLGDLFYGESKKAA